MAMCLSHVPSFDNIFELDLELESQNAAKSRHTPDHDPTICGLELTTMIARLTSPASWADKEMALAVLRAKPVCRGADGFMVELLTEALQAAGKNVQFCLTVPQRGSKSRQMLENLHHKYIKWQRETDGLEIIVEPRFREQFLITRPIAEYECLLGHIPEVFVGHPRRLRSLVEAVCPIMAKVFAAKRQVLPPWRSTAAMLSKWQLSCPPPSSLASSLFGLLQPPTLRLQSGQRGPVQGAHACVDDCPAGRVASISSAVEAEVRKKLSQPLSQQELPRQAAHQQPQAPAPASAASTGQAPPPAGRTRVHRVPRLEEDLLPRRRKPPLGGPPAGQQPAAALRPRASTGALNSAGHQEPAPAAAPRLQRASAPCAGSQASCPQPEPAQTWESRPEPGVQAGRPLRAGLQEDRPAAFQQDAETGTGQVGLQQWSSAADPGSVRGREVFTAARGCSSQSDQQLQIQHDAMRSEPMRDPLASPASGPEPALQTPKSGDGKAPVMLHLHATSPPSDWLPVLPVLSGS